MYQRQSKFSQREQATKVLQMLGPNGGSLSMDHFIGSKNALVASFPVLGYFRERVLS